MLLRRPRLAEGGLGSDHDLAVRLERLAGETSSRLISTVADQLPDGIDETLRRTMDVAGGDRIALLAVTEDGSGFYPTHAVSREPHPGASAFDLMKTSAVIAALLRGDHFQLSVLHAVPVGIQGRADTRWRSRVQQTPVCGAAMSLRVSS